MQNAKEIKTICYQKFVISIKRKIILKKKMKMTESLINNEYNIRDHCFETDSFCQSYAHCKVKFQ